MSRDIQPSQSPAVTAPPEGEPRHTPTPASERSCLSPRERWQRVALTERGRGRCLASPQADPASRLPASRTSPRIIQMAFSSMPRDVRRPSPTFVLSVVYAQECCRCYALSVTFGDSSPRGGAKAYPNTRIRAFLPLPAGEVAMPQALAERGRGQCPASPQADPASRLPASRTSPRVI